MTEYLVKITFVINSNCNKEKQQINRCENLRNTKTYDTEVDKFLTFDMGLLGTWPQYSKCGS